MSEPFIGEIRIFAGNFAPRGWAFCNGQLMPVSQNTALFSILGKIYGGDGRTNFALPNLQGRAPMHQGAGPGLSPRTIGQAGGTSAVTITQNQMPQHTHVPQANPNLAAAQDPTGAVWAQAYRQSGPSKQPRSAYAPQAAGTEAMAANALLPAGGSASHNNMQPYLGLSFIIALQGIYPVRS